MGTRNEWLRGVTSTILAGALLVAVGCQSSPQPRSGIDLGPDASADVSAASDGGPDASAGDPGDAAADAPIGPVGVTVSESTYTFDTPDLSHSLVATVTGSPTITVTWSTSNSYIATVSAAGIITSVSGGDAIITATSTADPTKSASCTVTVAEPQRPRATSYVDAKSITSGPVTIIMAGDSLMRTYAANTADQAGWGQVLNQFFTSDVTVDNTLSNGGRSSRSFYNEVGRWDLVKTRLMAAQAAGTPAFVFIMFAHNDQKKTTDTDGPLYLTFASNNQNGTVAGTYSDYLERYIVETRALGGIPVLFTPFVREYLQGAPAAVTPEGQHDITAIYAGETTARGDYPAAARAIAAKHDVPLVDITAWSKTMVEAHAATATLPYVYISGDQTHVRNLGALLMAEEAVRALNAQGILASYAKAPAPRLMLDSSSLAFGGIFAGNTLDKSFIVSAFKDATGTITVTPPASYTVSTDGTTFGPTATITADASFVGTVVSVRFSPTDSVGYNGDLTVEPQQPHARLRQHCAQRQRRYHLADRQRQDDHRGGAGDGDLADVRGDGDRLRRDDRRSGERDLGDADRPREQERRQWRRTLRHARRHLAGRGGAQSGPLRRIHGSGDDRLAHARLDRGRRRLGRRQQHALGHRLFADVRLRSADRARHRAQRREGHADDQHLPQPRREHRRRTDAVPARLSLQHQRRRLGQVAHAGQRRRLRRHQLIRLAPTDGVTPACSAHFTITDISFVP